MEKESIYKERMPLDQLIKQNEIVGVHNSKRFVKSDRIQWLEMRNFMQRILFYVMNLSKFWLPILLSIIISYSLYFVLDDESIIQLGHEGQLFENLTALFFLGASFLFLLSFLRQNNYWFLLLSIVFFIGFGEEIAWGQQVFHFKTPDWLSTVNVQKDFTLHNIEIFNAHGFDHNLKSGTSKLHTINFLYKLFWLIYCILLPIVCLCWRQISSLVAKIRLPIPNLLIGIFFLVNWVAFKGMSDFLLPSGKPIQYYYTITEMRECLSALIFMIISINFLNFKND